ncbi:MAG: alpha-L-rhamnosidase N-terminal domain-containing protein [Micromonosporaceae bacterium]|nr:alpha-L-rhamnosidase N-terminal domain-containing protein [Micromonosporaceae bacterium]
MSRVPQRRRRPQRHPGRWLLGLLVVALAAGGAAFYFRQTAVEDGAVSAVGLRTEFLTNPLGIDTTTPRLSWVPSTTRDFTRQHAYQIQVAESSSSLGDGVNLQWDSGRMESAQSWGIAYTGTPLVSGHQYCWRVRLWDGNQRASDWSEQATWQMGLLDDAAWGEATWIAASAKTAPAAVLLRRAFEVEQGKVQRATLTVAGLGFHVLYANGTRVGDSVMAPAWTGYSDRIAYTTYDVTTMIKAGAKNVVGVALAGGWYHPNSTDTAGLATMSYVDEEKLLARLDIQLEGGTAQTIVSDKQWTWATGDVTYASVRGGEDIDHTKSRKDWSSREGEVGAFSPVSTKASPKGKPKLVSTTMPLERKIGTIELTRKQTGTGYLYTLERNVTGTLLLMLTGTPGTTVRIQVGEGLDGDRVDPSWHDLNDQVGTGRWQQVNLTLASAERETFETSFTYFAGSYLDLEITAGRLTAEPSMQVYEVHTDLAASGSFTSANKQLNALHEAVRRTYLNNAHGYPTCSPQRDRLGAGAIGAAMAETGLLNFSNASTMYAKWMADFRDAQSDDGFIPLSAPATAARSTTNWSPWWGNALATVPLDSYRLTSDRRVLEDQYPAMRQYADYLLKRANGGIWPAATTLAPDEQAIDTGDISQFNTLGVYVAVQAVVETAKILSKDEDMYVYKEKAELVRSAFNTKWFSKARHAYARQAGGTFKLAPQSVLAIAISTGIVPDGESAAVLSSLLGDIAKPAIGQKYAYRLLTGVVGTRYLFRVLADAGAADTAHRILTQSGYPGVLPAALSAEGTLYERTTDAGGSHNSPGFGSFGTWLFRGVGGIRLDDLNSTGLIKIRPGLVNGVAWAEAEVVTVRGTVSSRWERTSTGIRYRIVVPVGAAAELSILATAGNVAQGSQRVATFTDPAASDRQMLHLRSGTYIIETR